MNEENLGEYSGTTLVTICVLFITLETTFVLLRYYARQLTSAGFGWDDAIIPLAWITNVALCIVGIGESHCYQVSGQKSPTEAEVASVHNAGVGHHSAYVMRYHPTQLETWAKVAFAMEVLYLPSAALPKFTVLCFYLRVFTRRDARMTCYCLLGFVAATWIAYLLAAVLQCKPLAYKWDRTIPGGRCFDIEAFYKTTSMPNILTDLIMLVLPIPTVINLQTSKVQKVECLLVFMIGSM